MALSNEERAALADSIREQMGKLAEEVVAALEEENWDTNRLIVQAIYPARDGEEFGHLGFSLQLEQEEEGDEPSGTVEKPSKQQHRVN